ncbi:hypothetical protein MMC30_003585 [Trapelia coarctata]|nr:hypothetical protein [Trapelia coarctata]
MVKFHYVNRKSEGVKLGQVVAKDLLKRLPPGSSYKTALRDPCVDLDVSGKLLTDDGFVEVTEALVKSIQYQDDNGRVLKLEEVWLKGNELTASSLKPLAKVVALAWDDLRDLDLSENRITISTSEDAAAWEEFLQSFSSCCVLRRIDFSGNNLGSKAFEVLARVYGKEKSFDTQGMVGICSSHPLPHSENPAEIPSSVQSSSRKGSPSSNAKGCVEPTSELARRGQRGTGQESETTDQRSHTAYPRSVFATNGIRSVPYLVFSGTAMTDACALYLSYIIACHDTPHRLLEHVPPAKAGLPAQQLEAYDQIPGCQGIIYRPNDGIGGAGTKVLELAEHDRRGSLMDITEEPGYEDGDASVSPASVTRRGSEARLPESPQKAAQRRRNTIWTGSFDESNSPSDTTNSSELNRARSRIQGDSLRDLGLRSNDLWCVSLKMLAVARIVLLEPKKKQVSPLRIDSRSADTPKSLLSSSNSARTAAGRLPSLSIPLAPGNPNHLMFPKLPQRRKESIVSPSLVMTPAAPPAVEKTHELPVRPKPLKKSLSYRTQLLGELDESTWGRIVSLACGGVGIVSKDQSVAVVRWARDRGSLEREMEALGKAESAQIWRVLEGMGCLAYEMAM